MLARAISANSANLYQQKDHQLADQTPVSGCGHSHKTGYTYTGGGCKHSIGERSGLACCRTERQPQN